MCVFCLSEVFFFFERDDPPKVRAAEYSPERGRPLKWELVLGVFHELFLPLGVYLAGRLTYPFLSLSLPLSPALSLSLSFFWQPWAGSLEFFLFFPPLFFLSRWTGSACAIVHPMRIGLVPEAPFSYTLPFSLHFFILLFLWWILCRAGRLGGWEGHLGPWIEGIRVGGVARGGDGGVVNRSSTSFLRQGGWLPERGLDSCNRSNTFEITSPRDAMSASSMFFSPACVSGLRNGALRLPQCNGVEYIHTTCKPPTIYAPTLSPSPILCTDLSTYLYVYDTHLHHGSARLHECA